jgi:hypothetical protein
MRQYCDANRSISGLLWPFGFFLFRDVRHIPAIFLNHDLIGYLHSSMAFAESEKAQDSFCVPRATT